MVSAAAFLLPGCYRNTRARTTQEDIQLGRIALAGRAQVCLGLLSTWFGATLNQRVLPTLRPPVANRKHWHVPDLDGCAYHLGVKCLQGLKCELYLASNGVMECPCDPRSGLEHLHIGE